MSATNHQQQTFQIIQAESPALLGGRRIREGSYPLWPEYGPAEEAGLLEVLHSREWGGYNPLIKKLEEKFAARHHTQRAIAMCNGTVTLVAALKACGVGLSPEDEVIVPTYTFFASASSVRLAGAKVRFVDVDPATLNIAPDEVSAAIGPHTKAVMPVHFAGQPADLEPLQRLCQQHNLALVEDAAQAHGAVYRNQVVGSWGDIASFSFQASKNITSGEGGMITTNDPALADLAWGHGNQGRRPGGLWYEHFEIGANYRMTGFQAAMALAQLDRLDEQMARRQVNAARLDKLLTENPHWGLTPIVTSPNTTAHAYHLYVTRYRSEALKNLPRARFLAALEAEGVPCSAGYPVILPQQPVFASDGPSDMSRYPASLQAVQDVVWFSQRVLLGEEEDIRDLAYILERINRFAAALLD